MFHKSCTETKNAYFIFDNAFISNILPFMR